MTDLVPADEIESIVGAKRHPYHHLGRAVSAEQTVYILHSMRCLESGIDLRHCNYSRALDRGIDEEDWADYLDKPVVLAVVAVGHLNKGVLLPLTYEPLYPLAGGAS